MTLADLEATGLIFDRIPLAFTDYSGNCRQQMTNQNVITCEQMHMVHELGPSVTNSDLHSVQIVMLSTVI